MELEFSHEFGNEHQGNHFHESWNDINMSRRTWSCYIYIYIEPILFDSYIYIFIYTYVLYPVIFNRVFFALRGISFQNLQDLL